MIIIIKDFPILYKKRYFRGKKFYMGKISLAGTAKIMSMKFGRQFRFMIQTIRDTLFRDPLRNEKSYKLENSGSSNTLDVQKKKGFKNVGTGQDVFHSKSGDLACSQIRQSD